MHAERLSLADAVRYHMTTPRNPMEIGVVLMLADTMTGSELERFVTERLLPHERFRQTVAKASFPLRPSWREERSFDLKAHVAVHAGPRLSHTDLVKSISERQSQRFPASRSPWSMELFPLDDGGSALLFRVHHCVADGLSLVRLLCQLADAPRPSTSAPPSSAPRPARRSLPDPREAFHKMWELLGGLLRTATACADPAEELHVPSGQKCVAWSSPLDLAALSHTAESRGCHVTDLLLTASAEALARGLAASGRPVPRRVHALVPVGASPGRRELGNHFASTFVELALDEPDAFRRIEHMNSTSKLHDPAQARFERALIGLAGWLSPRIMRSAMYRLSRRASLVLSNVPGPSQHVRLWGHSVNSVIVFAPASLSVGLSFTLFGYAGELRLGVETDAAVPLTPAQLVADFEQTLRGLSESPRGA
jgi:WS/DGAT/MGAT family acyltransferase